MDWEGWEDAEEEHWIEESTKTAFADRFTMRGLESALGLGKSEVSKAIARSTEVGLVIRDRKTGYPKPNTGALQEFTLCLRPKKGLA